MSGRRQDVLAVLRGADAPLSITAVADRLSIHPNTARFHLVALLRTGQVESVETDRSKPGRPPLMFRAVPGMDPAGPRDYRMLAWILVAALAGRPNPARRAAAAGSTWAKLHIHAREARSRRSAVERRTNLLAVLGIAPAERSGAGGIGELVLHNCPFLEPAQTSRDVVCPVHMGLMKGALSAWDAPITVSELTPFAEPGLCVVHLAPAENAS